MAKAKAICRCKYCGKEFQYVTFKNSAKDARAFEEWAAEHFDECPDCEEKRLAEERAEMTRIAVEAAKSKAWPELTGSEKQVAWAVRIRETEIGRLTEEAVTNREKYGEKYDYELAKAAISSLLFHTRASWWIDNRQDIREAFIKAGHDIKNNVKRAPAPDLETRQDETTIASPEDQTHSGAVDIQACEQNVSAFYPKDEDFRKIVKSLGYKWDRENSAWTLSINFSTGSSAERAAELGNKLLNAGFAIRIQDPDTLRNAIEGRYEPMCQRWISKNTKTGRFIISWARNDDFYDKAKRLPGARYISSHIQVPAEEWESVLDFAHTYGFSLSPGAQKLVDKMQAATIVVRPAATKDAAYETHPLQDVLNSSRDIIEDLIDEADN